MKRPYLLFLSAAIMFSLLVASCTNPKRVYPYSKLKTSVFDKLGSLVHDTLIYQAGEMKLIQHNGVWDEFGFQTDYGHLVYQVTTSLSEHDSTTQFSVENPEGRFNVTINEKEKVITINQTQSNTESFYLITVFLDN